MSEYACPSSVKEAIGCLARHAGEARVIAGGTDVLPDLRKGKIAPRCLVDVTRIPALQQIEVGGGMVAVGAAVTFAAIRQHPFLRRHVHALVEAAGSVGAGAIQNAATWGGNIVQAMPAADGAIVALALDAEAQIIGRDGSRWELVEALFAGPGVTAVDPTREILTRLRFPCPGENTGTGWRRVGRRSALVLPILNCATRLEISQEGDGPRVRRAAIALGPVAPRPYRARKTEAYLAGRLLTPDMLERAARIACDESNPRSSVMRASREYRLEIIPALVSDALTVAASRARAGSEHVGSPGLVGAAVKET